MGTWTHVELHKMVNNLINNYVNIISQQKPFGVKMAK